jgi:anti-sigma regulatory factor (Ser/Thr protein kinase)
MRYSGQFPASCAGHSEFAVLQELDFQLLDDLVLAHQSATISPDALPGLEACAMAPLLELRHCGALEWCAHTLNVGPYAGILGACGRTDSWFSGHDRQGYLSVEASSRSHAAWTEFAMKAKRAAVNTGFAADDAGQLVAAMGELSSNIVEHSERMKSGYLAYEATPGQFEFVAADAGVGILASLRSRPSFATLADAGAALSLALSDGVSRFEDASRGRGFRPIFIGLANASEHLRFRSDDHCREIYRKDGQLRASTKQRANLQGFFAAALCKA